MTFADLERGLLNDVRAAAEGEDFDTLEAIALYAHDFGHYRIADALHDAGFKASPGMSAERWAKDPSRREVMRIYRSIASAAKRATRGGSRTPNPSRRGARKRVPQLGAASRTFRRWHGFDPDRVVTMKGPARQIPRTLVRLGDMVEIVYRSNKWEGRNVVYTHKTEKPHPVLCTSPDGRGLYVVGGGVKVTARGLVG